MSYADVSELTMTATDETAELVIQTTRFGRLTVSEDRVLTFSRGLLGFPERQRYALIQAGEENYFFWLQSVEEPGLAFVVTDPSIFFKTYEVPLKEETLHELEMTDPSFAQTFVICNKVGEWLTGNLLGSDRRQRRQPHRAAGGVDGEEVDDAAAADAVAVRRCRWPSRPEARAGSVEGEV